MRGPAVSSLGPFWKQGSPSAFCFPYVSPELWPVSHSGQDPVVSALLRASTPHLTPTCPHTALAGFPREQGQQYTRHEAPAEDIFLSSGWWGSLGPGRGSSLLQEPVSQGFLTFFITSSRRVKFLLDTQAESPACPRIRPGLSESFRTLLLYLPPYRSPAGWSTYHKGRGRRTPASAACCQRVDHCPLAMSQALFILLLSAALLTFFLPAGRAVGERQGKSQVTWKHKWKGFFSGKLIYLWSKTEQGQGWINHLLSVEKHPTNSLPEIRWRDRTGFSFGVLPS